MTNSVSIYNIYSREKRTKIITPTFANNYISKFKNKFIFETSIAFLINKHTILIIIHKEQYFRLKNEYDHVFYLEQKQRSKEQNETK